MTEGAQEAQAAAKQAGKIAKDVAKKTAAAIQSGSHMQTSPSKTASKGQGMGQ
jgi:hypothetical protein